MELPARGVETLEASSEQTAVGGVRARALENMGATMQLSLQDIQRIASFEVDFLTEPQRRKKQHRPNPKNTGGWSRRSRKKKHQKMRAPSRCTRHIYHATSEDVQALRSFMDLPQVQDVLVALRQVRAENRTQVMNLGTEEDPTDLPASALNSDAPTETQSWRREHVPWPSSVELIVTSKVSTKAAKRVEFTDIGAVHKCGCREQCTRETCINAMMFIYCTKANCTLRGVCGNSFGNVAPGLTLFRSRVGVGVYTQETIESGVIIGEYCGRLRMYKGIDKNKPDPSNLKHNTGYSMLLQTRPTKTGYFAFVEAVKYGGITRFLNHSCKANTEFRELRNRRNVKVAVVSTVRIEPGTEVTVDYGDDIWFPCVCESTTCTAINKSSGYQESTGFEGI